MPCNAYLIILHTSYYLWSISHPSKNGIPSFDLSNDDKATPITTDGMTPSQLAVERVITKVINHYSITLDITDKIRITFKSKLWRMRKKLSSTGGKKRKQLLCSWKEGKGSVWDFTVDGNEASRQMTARKRQVEEQLQQQTIKQLKLEEEVKELKHRVQTQSAVISDLSSKKKRRSTSKHWTQYSRQQKAKIKKRVADNLRTTLNILCEHEKLKVCNIEMINIDTQGKEILDIGRGTFSQIQETPSSSKKLNSTLLIKDKYGISNEAYHELHMLHPQLPNYSQIQKTIKEMNSTLTITNTPNNTMGVQINLRPCVTACLSHLLPSTTGTQRKVRIKLTGDGTQIARGLNVVIFAFTILEKDLNPTSAHGSHPVAIIRTTETFDKSTKHH